MHVLFEEDGDLKAGTVRLATDASFQVDSTSGKRIKVKAAAVLLRFEQPRADELLALARADAAGMDVDFLWQCAPQEEFGFEQLAREYSGRAPTAVEAAAILMRLQSAPVYFQRKGRGRFRPATPDVLRAALAAVERRRLQDELRDRMVDELVQGVLPGAIAAQGVQLLLAADRNTGEFKALEQAAHRLQISPLRLMLARGAIASPWHWHLAAFLARAFPRGVGFAADLPAPAGLEPALPLAVAPVFSIDDSATTEIDDAFSVRWNHGGAGASGAALTVGIHIAAPALAVVPGHPLDAVARARMSTVYAPGLKYTMLPDPWIEAFSLAQGRTAPVLSLYLELDPHTFAVLGTRTVLESVQVAANLRYDLIEADCSQERMAAGDLQGPYAAELLTLWRLAGVLRAEREKARGRPEAAGREEVSIQLDGAGDSARVRLYARRRDTPLDRIVAELMIHANSHWGAWLETLGRVGIYRSQALGRVRMSTTPAPHEGLGVSRYAWCTSPLRRYVDLLNQRQLIAAVRGDVAPHRRGDADLFSVVSAFDAAYTMYAEFQQAMERYWSLRWLQQEGVHRIEATVVRGDIVRLQGLPMTVRIAAAASHERGQRLELEIVSIDLVELAPDVRIAGVLTGAASPDAAADDGDPGAVDLDGMLPDAAAAPDGAAMPDDARAAGTVPSAGVAGN
jgi:exoribonuclease-2